MSRTTFKHVTLSNFMSFGRGPFTVPLDGSQNTLVLGENQDVGNAGESRNGAGKSTVMQAIFFALYGKGFDKMKADQFVNLINGKRLVVTLSFTQGGTDYEITRGRKPARLEFIDTTNGTSLTRDSMKNTEEEILRVVGYPYEVFSRTVFMSPHIGSILSLDTAEQRSFIEQVLSLDVLADRAETLKKVIRKDLQEEVRLATRSLEQAEQNNARVEQNLARLQRQSVEFEEEKKQKVAQQTRALEGLRLPPQNIEELFVSIEQGETLIRSLTSAWTQLTEEVSTVEGQINKLVGSGERIQQVQEREQSHDQDRADRLATLQKKVDEYEPVEVYEEQINAIEEVEALRLQLREVNREAEQKSKEKQRLSRDMDKNLAEAEHLAEGKCPYCLQEHLDQKKMDGLLSEAEEQQEKIISLEEAIEETGEKADAIEKQIEAQKTASAAKSDPRQGLEQARKAQAALDASKEAGSTNPYTKELQELTEKHGTFDEIMQQIEELEKQVENLKAQVKQEEARIKQEKEAIETTREACMGFSTPREVELCLEKQSSLEADIERLRASENPHTSEMEHTQKLLLDLESLKATLADAEANLTHVNYLIRLLTDPKSFIRKNIVDQYMPLLNKRINVYAEKVGSAHIFEINSDLSVDIYYMGHAVSYYMLSQGERLRANIATSLAFRYLMETLGRSTNLLLVDELLDSASDESGLNSIFALLQNVAESVFIISHRDEFKDSVDQIMRVVKKNGFSEVEYQ